MSFYFYIPLLLVFNTCADTSELRNIKLSAALSEDSQAAIFQNAIADKDPDRYICPMHSEVRSDRPGTCPKCGMKLKIIGDQGGSDAHHHH